jgi:hypothetical protein
MSPDSLHPYATPLRLEPARSVRLAGWLLSGHTGAILLLPWLPLHPLLQLALGLALCGSLLWHWLDTVLRSLPGSVRSFTWLAGSDCRVQPLRGPACRAQLCGAAFVQPWLVILGYRTGRRRRRYLLLLPDMLDPDTYRRLRVRLRTGHC